MNGDDSGLDDVFDALAHEDRRVLLLAMLERNPRSARVIPGDAPPDESEARGRKLDFYHLHVPKLADYGFVDWDQVADEVTKGPRFDELRPFLEPLREQPQYRF